MASKPPSSPFFVGYLKTPAALKKFYIPVVALLFGASMLIGYSLANMQKATGAAQWLTDSPLAMQGLIKLEPYPVLHRFNPEMPGQIESILLVNQGKRSAKAFTEEFDGQYATVTGFPIYRGGWSMLELRSHDDVQSEPMSEALTQQLNELNASVQATSLGAVAFSGEIADSKCFLGVMKPGEGVVHRACAEVCLIGGLPAMLLVKGADQQRYGYILTSDAGASVSRLVADKAGDVMQVAGELWQKGNLLYIQSAAFN